MMDGMPVVGLMDQVTKTTYAIANQRSTDGLVESGGVQNIFEGVNPSLQTSSVSAAIEQGKQRGVLLRESMAIDC
jgi:hypothetical protein